MNKVLLMVASIFAILTIQGCSPSSVAEGEEAALVYQPYIFGHGGVDSEPIKTGLIWTAWSTKVVRVNIKPFTIDETFDDIVTADNLPVDFKIHLTVEHIAGKTPELVEKFGDWYSNKAKEPLRNMARDLTKSHTTFQMTTDASVIAKMERSIFDELSKFLKDEDIPVRLHRITIGKVLPPKEVIDSTVATAVQKQRVKTQNERVKAEESRKAAEIATARADKAYMQEMGMTPQQYLKNKELDIIERKTDVKVFIGTSPIPMVKG